MGFGMGGLAASLNQPEGNQSATASSTETRDGLGSATPDYKAILTSILEKGAPEKVGLVDGYLAKHKVSNATDAWQQYV